VPRFHLHVRDASGFARDDEGHEYPSAEAARLAAVAGARSMLGHELVQGALDLRGWIDLEDATGTVIERLFFRDLVEVKLGALPPAPAPAPAPASEENH
jgi:hypothetical protein